MTKDPNNNGHRVRQADVSRLPFTAGVVLIICGLNTVLEGLYTIDYWQGWLFLTLGVIVGGTGLMLIFRVPAAGVAALAAAAASLTISAVWVSTYHWFNLAAIALDLVAIGALARSALRLRAGKDPLRT